jgi:hypothetical protein
MKTLDIFPEGTKLILEVADDKSWVVSAVNKAENLLHQVAVAAEVPVNVMTLTATLSEVMTGIVNNFLANEKNIG